jgi:hypothetical protein
MTGPKLETALQGLQDAINELDRTILDTAGRLSAPRASETSSDISDVFPPADSGMSADMLRAELEALRQMIANASALIDGEQEDSLIASDEVLH